MDEPLNLYIVSHTHWDREWYYSFQRYRWRFVKTVDRLLDIMEQDPEYRYFMMDGQVLVLKDYLEVRPENRPRVESLVKAGRLLVGPWYSQPNEYMVSGESMIRNLLLGIRESEALGGVMRVCYLPDAFGQITQLPQIARGFGMAEASFHRGAPVKSDTVFQWTGADGSELTVLNTYGGYHLAYDLPLQEEDFTEIIDSQVCPREGLNKRVNGLISILKEFSKTPNMLFMNGVDHAGPQRNLSQVIRKINAMFPGVTAVHSTLQEYANAVRAYHEKSGVPMARVQGELRHCQGYILEGSQSTRADVKIINNRIEGMFEKWMEPFTTFCWMLGAKYPSSLIWRAWEYLLQNHAHDSMACSSTDATYHQVKTRFEWAEELGSEILAESLMTLCNRIDCTGAYAPNTALLTVFNPLSWERSEAVTATIDIPRAAGITNPMLYDGDKPVPMNIHSARPVTSIRFNLRVGMPDVIPLDRYTVTIQAGSIPAMGYKAFTVRSNPLPFVFQGTMATSHNAMENEYLRVSFHADGTFDLYDKRTLRTYPNQHFFEDSGEAGEGFSRVPPLMDRVILSTSGGARISLVENTSLRVTYQVDMELELPESLTADRQGRSGTLVPCSISSRITLLRGAARVDIHTTVVNRAKDHRLRVVFPSMISGDTSYAETPFDVVNRNIATPDPNDFPGEKPYREHPQLSFAGITDGEVGLMVANQGLYEYEVIDNTEHSIAVTLLRCLDRIIGGPIYVSEDLLIPEAQCLGEYSFDYSVIPHAGSWRNAYREAYGFRFPMKAVVRRDLEDQQLPEFDPERLSKVLPVSQAFVEVDSADLVVTAVKKHETRESLVVRVLNISEKSVSGAVRVNAPGFAAGDIYRISLEERRQEKLAMGNGGWIPLDIVGRGIVTVEFERKE